MAYGNCQRCDEVGELQGHHIISRKQQPALIKCNSNIINLCWSCHHGTYGIHGKYPEKIREELRGKFQDKLYELFIDKELFEFEEIQKRLEIKFTDMLRLSKAMYPIAGLYKREDIIRACMGERLEK